MSRLSYEELNRIKEQHKTDRIWSWSRLECFRTSPYEYLLKYILKKQGDKCDSCYTTLGSCCHTALEKFYGGQITYEEMINDFDDSYLTAIIIAGLRFNRTDDEKDKSIGMKYNENLRHFFQNHVVYKQKLALEVPIVIDVDNNVFVGYADAVFRDEEGCFHIIDFKSSSIYSGKTLEEHSGQLTLYALGLHQKGVPLDKIKIAFNFLKYCTITYPQKNGKIKETNCERSKIGEKLQASAKTWLKACGYDENTINEHLKLMLDTNSIAYLPEEVKSKYTITDCHVYVDDLESLVEKWTDVIQSTIKDIRLREADYERTKSDKCFWDTDESVKAQSYYFANLCDYSPNLHLPYKEYLEKLELAKGASVFDSVGNDVDSIEPTLNNVSDSKVISQKKDKVDLSWLNDLEL